MGNSQYEAGRFTEAINGLSRQFDRFEKSVNEKFDKIDDRLRQFSDYHPTRREFDDVKLDLQGVAKTARDAKEGVAKNEVWGKIWLALVTALVIGSFGLSHLG